MEKANETKRSMCPTHATTRTPKNYFSPFGIKTPKREKSDAKNVPQISLRCRGPGHLLLLLTVFILRHVNSPIHKLAVPVLVANKGLKLLRRWRWRHLKMSHDLLLILQDSMALNVAMIILLVEGHIHAQNLLYSTLDP